MPRTCSRPCAFEVKKTKKEKTKSHQTLKKTHNEIVYIHSSPAAATTSRRRAVKHVPLGSPYSHSSSIDLGLVKIGLACIRTYVYTRTAAAAAAPPVYVLVLLNYFLASAASSFCADTRMYLRFLGCPVVLDIELSVIAWYHKNRRVQLRARRLLLLLLLTAESKERRLAVCGVRFKLASNGAETK